MTVPDPNELGPEPRRPSGGLDPMPTSTTPPPLGDRPGRPTPADPTRPVPDDPGGLLRLVATGREDRLRHVVEVESGALGDPAGLRARCGAPVQQVVPGLRADQADCPGCSLAVHR